MDRQFWSYEDVRSLITVWAEDDVQQKIDGVCRNEDVMKHIATELSKLGILRTTQQIREKLKKLRAQYKSAKLHNSGSDVHPKKFPFFDLMDSVLGHRPCVSSNTARDIMTFQEPDTDVPQTAESACSIKESVSSPTSCLSASPVLDETTNPEVPSLLSAATSSTPVKPKSLVKPSTSTSHLKEPSRQIPPQTRAEPLRRRTSGQLDFIAAMKEIADKDREAERELRLQEAKMEEQLRREEMAQMEQMVQERSRETQELMALLATLLPQKPQD